MARRCVAPGLAWLGMDRLLPWLRRSGWAYVAAAVVLALVAWRIGPGGGGGGGQPAAARGRHGGGRRRAPPEPRRGWCTWPGRCGARASTRSPPGARVIAAIRRAGGPTRRADMSALNLAATLQDGQQVLVPARGRRPARAAAAGAGAGGGGGPAQPLVAPTTTALDALDGIGPTLAARIVEWRTAHGGFASVDQLLEVPGIGPTRLESPAIPGRALRWAGSAPGRLS